MVQFAKHSVQISAIKSSASFCQKQKFKIISYFGRYKNFFSVVVFKAVICLRYFKLIN